MFSNELSFNTVEYSLEKGAGWEKEHDGEPCCGCTGWFWVLCNDKNHDDTISLCLSVMCMIWFCVAILYNKEIQIFIDSL